MHRYKRHRSPTARRVPAGKAPDAERAGESHRPAPIAPHMAAISTSDSSRGWRTSANKSPVCPEAAASRALCALASFSSSGMNRNSTAAPAMRTTANPRPSHLRTLLCRTRRKDQNRTPRIAPRGQRREYEPIEFWVVSGRVGTKAVGAAMPTARPMMSPAKTLPGFSSSRKRMNPNHLPWTRKPSRSLRTATLPRLRPTRRACTARQWPHQANSDCACKGHQEAQIDSLQQKFSQVPRHILHRIGSQAREQWRGKRHLSFPRSAWERAFGRSAARIRRFAYTRHGPRSGQAAFPR